VLTNVSSGQLFKDKTANGNFLIFESESGLISDASFLFQFPFFRWLKPTEIEIRKLKSGNRNTQNRNGLQKFRL